MAQHMDSSCIVGGGEKYSKHFHTAVANWLVAHAILFEVGEEYTDRNRADRNKYAAAAIRLYHTCNRLATNDHEKILMNKLKVAMGALLV